MKETTTLKKNVLSFKTIAFIFLIVSFILYGNTIGSKYCLDDAIVITQNKFTQKGLSGLKDIFTTESFTGFFGESKALVSGARYRPLSIATFAVENEIFGNTPFVSHFINILLFFITGLLLFRVLQLSVQGDESKKIWIAFTATLLFLFHPIHTEVVANIKGRDEILSLLFALLSIKLIYNYLKKLQITYLIYATIAFFLGLLAKENAFFVIVLLPLFLYSSGYKSVKDYFKPLGYLLIASFLYLIIRYKVTEGMVLASSDELMNNSFLGATTQQKFATIFYTLGLYLKLLVFPYPLTYDYYPYHIALTDWSNWFSWFSIIAYIILGILMIVYIKKKTIISLSFAIYLIPLAPVSNILFPIGVFMNERFLFISSVGFCLLIAYFIITFYFNTKKLKSLVFIIVPVILMIWGLETINRNKAWYNDYTLFITDVNTSFNSAKSNCSAGGVLLESTDTIINTIHKQEVLNRACKYLIKAVEIHPLYNDAWLLLGNVYFKMGTRFDSASFCYENILRNAPKHQLALKNLIALAQNIQDADERINIYKKVISYDPMNYIANYKLGQLYGREKNDLDLSVHYLTRAGEINPNSIDVYIDLGVAYGLKKDYKISAQMLEKALSINPNEVNILMNLGLTYQFMGNIEKAQANFMKADSLKKLK